MDKPNLVARQALKPFLLLQYTQISSSVFCEVAVFLGCPHTPLLRIQAQQQIESKTSPVWKESSKQCSVLINRCNNGETLLSIETFSIRFFMGNRKPETAVCG